MNVRFQEKPTVVLGDHSLESVSGVTAAFTNAGFAIAATCMDGIALVRAARELNPNVICLDLILPRLSGLQVLEAIAGQVTSRLIVATAVSSRGRVAEAKRLGVSMYVLKPFDRETFANALRGSLNQQLRSAS